MTPPTFHIGDDVEVIGPSITGNDIHLGKRFKIECMYVNPSQHIQFEPYDGTYYPASSLRLVELELKMGDWVEVIGKPMPLYAECLEHEIGRIFEITQEDTKNHEWFSCQCNPTYPATSLRKLTPDEIKQHTNSTLLKKAHETEDRLSAIEKRLDFIEKIQREQAEYRRNMLWRGGS